MYQARYNIRPRRKCSAVTHTLPLDNEQVAAIRGRRSNLSRFRRERSSSSWIELPEIPRATNHPPIDAYAIDTYAVEKRNGERRAEGGELAHIPHNESSADIRQADTIGVIESRRRRRRARLADANAAANFKNDKAISIGR